ncbi:MAG: nucleoside diphosphate kinase regulator [Anaerolineales bacterium]|jgi:regulator of nucleoside diphosphate kinase|nr:nucleoside diphosphate kinase regulator [Anaerolineales bacterium]
MKPNTIYITQVDLEKIRNLIWEAQNAGYRVSTYIQALKEELDRAEIVNPQDVPPDVITMNTKAILLDTETSELMEFTLVFPADADVAQGKISILAPVGTGMLGYRVGDVFEWNTPGGKRKLRVEKILEQPEAFGNYD